MAKAFGWFMVPAVLAAFAACGSSEDASEANGDMDAPVDEGTGNTDTGPDGGTTVNLGDLANMVIPMCDESVESVAECGGVTCPELVPLIANAICQVNCCVDDACGTKTVPLTVAQPTECVRTILPDDRCPDLPVGPLNVEGCCVEGTDACGLLVVNTCIERGQAQSSIEGLLSGFGGGFGAGAASDDDAGMSTDAGNAGTDAGMSTVADGGTPTGTLGLDLSPINCDGTRP